MKTSSPVIEQAAGYREKIYGYLRGKNIQEADRDDVYGEIVLKIARLSGSYDSAKASLSTWVYTITRSVVADYFRGRRLAYPLDEEIPGDDDVESHIEYEEELGELASQLERLPERERRAILLRYYRDMEYAEIAARLGVSEANARKICSRALEKLRKRMA